ncbi:MAG: primosomal protein N' [Candidatus Moranbacteria bacterium]|nr:primosomal protein N' [Candidatus Moranbacteria bacterium]
MTTQKSVSATSGKASVWHVEVAPLTSLPLTRGQFFTYASDVEVRPGALVSIPVTTRTLKGVVFASRNMSTGKHKMPPFRVKPILSVIREDFLTPEQLQLAIFISKRYFTSLGRTLVHFIPQVAKARAKTGLPAMQQAPMSAKRIHPTQEQLSAIEKISRPSTKPFYLFGPASSGKTEVYIRSIKAKLEAGEQALVLVPELTLIPQEIGRYGEAFGKENIAIIHSHLTTGTFYETWARIARGEAQVIIGTRQALFAPFKNLRFVVVDEEQDDAYKQWDMSPRYDGRDVAEKLAAIHHANLVFGSATPSIERFHKAHERTYTLLKLSALPMQPHYDIKLVNLRFERHNKNFGSLSEELMAEMTLTLKAKRQIFLFINRQGASSFSVCDHCKTILKCPSCERALVFDASLSIYRCLHCSHKSSATPACVSCGGVNFKNVGTGTQKIERDVLKRFPYSKVARIDRQTMQKKGAQEKVFRNFAQGNIDILIGTQMATKGWDLPNVALVGMIDADSLFAWADFKTDENAFQHILQAAGRMARIGSRSHGTALIQTFYPENPTLQKIQIRDFPTFYKETAEQREMLFYPPFGRLIKIIFQHEESKKVEKETQKIHTKLTGIAGRNRALRISEPQHPIIAKVRENYRKQIIIRCKEQKLPTELSDFFLTIAKDCIIDIDPISLI